MSNIEALINQMAPKKENKKIGNETNKKSQHTEKFKSTIKETEFDYYKILGVGSTASQTEIKQAYQKKLKKLHPDKVTQTKENIAKYKLLREAGDLLSDPHERKAYDMQKKMTSNADFTSIRNQFDEFIKLQEQSMTDENKSIAKLNFERGLLDMDRKHGYDRTSLEPISKEEHDRRVEDLTLQREQEELEIAHDDIFKGRQFNHSEFNKLFNKKKQMDSRRKTHDGLVKCDDIMAYNDYVEASGGVSIEHYDALYAEGNYQGCSDKYAGIDSGMIGNENDLSDDISLDSLDDDYDNHNKAVSKESFDDAMKKMLSERSEQDHKFDTMGHNEYGSALDDKYGISHQFGFMIGNDKFGHQKNIKNTDVSDETIKAYKQLTEK